MDWYYVPETDMWWHPDSDVCILGEDMPWELRS